MKSNLRMCSLLGCMSGMVVLTAVAVQLNPVARAWISAIAGGPSPEAMGRALVGIFALMSLSGGGVGYAVSIGNRRRIEKIRLTSFARFSALARFAAKEGVAPRNDLESAALSLPDQIRTLLPDQDLLSLAGPDLTQRIHAWIGGQYVTTRR